uniref:PPM-type phosphatase domain-containing protein n=1 Tax=Salmo trutta TaxID=8032 RepID=A0A674DI54_SALTR
TQEALTLPNTMPSTTVGAISMASHLPIWRKVRGASRMAEYSVTKHKGSNPFICAVAVCEEKNSTWKKNMEDVTVFHEGYECKEGTSFFGFFDGFHGQISAVTAAKEMPVLVLEQLSKQNPLLSLEKDQVKLLSRFEALFQEDYNRPYPGQAQNIALGLGPKQLENLTKVEQVNLAFTTAFWMMDRVLGLGKDETSKVRWSGCTALLTLSTNRSYPLNTINFQLTSHIDSHFTGNVHAVLYKQGSGFRLTKEHKHILRSGGAISINKQHGLVEVLTKPTRVLGHYGDRKLKKSVIPVPYSVSLPMDPSYQLLVLASSGLWEVLDEHAVAERALTDEDNPPELDMPETLGVARDMQIQRKQKDINPQSCSRSEVNVKEPMADSLKNVTLDCECLAADICRELVDTALVSGSRENIPVMDILLQGLDVLRKNTQRRVDKPNKYHVIITSGQFSRE